MRVSVVSPGELDGSLLRRWDQLHRALPVASPFFSAAFTRAVAQVRDDARVAVLEDEQGVSGFFPFHRRWAAGLAIGDYLSDHHGVVAAPGTSWNWLELLRACGLAYWRFDHLSAHQRPPGQVVRATSPAIDLSEGFEAWRERRLQAGARRLRELPRKARKLEREIGPLRFEADVRDAAVLDEVIRLKSAQCHRTGARD